jgi:DNA-binding transcriptional LysR family regulator
MANIFRKHSLDYDIVFRARFGTTVCSLVAAGLGIAIIDQYTVAHDAVRGVKTLEIEEPTGFQTYIAKRRDVELSTYAAYFVAMLRKEMNAVHAATSKGKAVHLSPASGKDTAARLPR